MQITLWTAEMLTAEETQIYIIPLDPPQARRRIMRSKLLTTLYRDKGHTLTHTHTHKDISRTRFQGQFLWPFCILYENNIISVYIREYTERLRCTKSMCCRSKCVTCSTTCQQYDVGVKVNSSFPYHVHIKGRKGGIAHTFTQNQPWWFGEFRLADGWKPGPIKSACLWLDDRSILSCCRKEAKEKKKGLVSQTAENVCAVHRHSTYTLSISLN